MAEVASAPITLFYAVQQAGRAILAAHAGERWQVYGHGLSVRTHGAGIGETVITPNGRGLFQAVSEAISSEFQEKPMTLGEVWARIPGLPRSADLEPPGVPLLAIDMGPGTQGVVRDEHGSLPDAGEDFSSLGQEYPQLAETAITVRQQGKHAVVNIDFPTAAEAAAFESSLWPYLGQGFILPPKTPSALMLWWMLTQALASLARYESATWATAISPDASKLAVPIEQTVETAMALVPRLVLDALEQRA